MSRPQRRANELRGLWEAPVSGIGIGLRSCHINHVLAQRPAVPWFEILADNHLAPGGVIPAQLEAVRRDYPVTLHCVGMSLAGTDPLDWAYLAGVKRLIDRYQPAWVSDHLCFTSLAGRHYHDLLPFPYTEQSLVHVSRRVKDVQDYLGSRILVENVSSYVAFNASTLTEAEFLAALSAEADCDLLVDVNNAYVNLINHGIDAELFLRTLPTQRIKEVHLAGFENKGTYLIDAHNNPVAEPVWDLYRALLERVPGVATLIEWDKDIPAFSVLMEQAQLAERIATGVASTRKVAS